MIQIFKIDIQGFETHIEEDAIKKIMKKLIKNNISEDLFFKVNNINKNFLKKNNFLFELNYELKLIIYLNNISKFFLNRDLSD